MKREADIEIEIGIANFNGLKSWNASKIRLPRWIAKGGGDRRL
jgi:hypothetical protein